VARNHCSLSLSLDGGAARRARPSECISAHSVILTGRFSPNPAHGKQGLHRCPLGIGTARFRPAIPRLKFRTRSAGFACRGMQRGRAAGPLPRGVVLPRTSCRLRPVTAAQGKATMAFTAQGRRRGRTLLPRKPKDGQNRGESGECRPTCFWIISANCQSSEPGCLRGAPNSRRKP
jgi:hypothetical protein